MSTKLTRRGLLKAGIRSTAGMCVMGAGAGVWSHKVEPSWIEVRHVSLTLPRLSAHFENFRLLQLSDIHMDYTVKGHGYMTRARLAGIVELVNSLNPDMVAITGDFVSGWKTQALRYETDLSETLGRLEAAHGVVAVLGNHDHWSDAPTLHRVLKRAAIHDLSNDVYSLHRGGDELHIAGIDDYWTENHDLPHVLHLLRREGAAILLAHEPDVADISVKTGRFDLQISGHTHGGQVCLPLFGPPVLPYLGKIYPMGLYQVGSMQQYTNRGIGMLPPYVRFNCRPEITIFTLHAGIA